MVKSGITGGFVCSKLGVSGLLADEYMSAGITILSCGELLTMACGELLPLTAGDDVAIAMAILNQILLVEQNGGCRDPAGITG